MVPGSTVVRCALHFRALGPAKRHARRSGPRRILIDGLGTAHHDQCGPGLRNDQLIVQVRNTTDPRPPPRLRRRLVGVRQRGVRGAHCPAQRGRHAAGRFVEGGLGRVQKLPVKRRVTAAAASHLDQNVKLPRFEQARQVGHRLNRHTCRHAAAAAHL